MNTDRVNYRWVDTDGETSAGWLYDSGHYFCLIRNQVFHLARASCGFAVYLNRLYEQSFG